MGLALGPDHNLWFLESATSRIARVTPAGAITEFPLPEPGSPSIDIAPGPGGAMWFTDANGDRFPVPDRAYVPEEGAGVPAPPPPP